MSRDEKRAELMRLGPLLFGVYGWQTKVARSLMVDGSTVRRWISGDSEVPGPAIAALLCFARQPASGAVAHKRL